MDCGSGGRGRQPLRPIINDNNDDLTAAVDSISKAGGLGCLNETADAKERSIPHGASPAESTSHRITGSS